MFASRPVLWVRHLAQASVTALMFVGAAASTAPALATSADPAVVQTEAGTVRGIADSTHRAFLGIPYAVPPVGALRWKSPLPAPAWAGERAASHMALPCAQPPSNFSYAIEQSQEDCLYLNVYTPPDAQAGVSLPVIVWIHGGANVIGSASEYPAATLAQTGHVVVVTVNYRLGVFGFLALPGLQQEDRKLNFAIQDQQLALRWVQRHIAPFGGDSRRVTVAGQSAGGGDALVHLVSPSSAGLFQRAIIQSASSVGVLGASLTTAQAIPNGQAFAQTAGCPDGPDQLPCLRGKTTQDILAATPYDESFLHPTGLWGVVLDGELLPAQIESRIKSGNFQRVPVLTGVTRHEFRLLSALAFEAVTGVPPTEADRKTALNFLTGSSAGNVLNAFYPTWAYGSPGNAMGSLLSDFIAICPAHRQTMNLAGQTTTYAYRFDDPNAPSILKDPTLKMGAYHAGELQYLFDQPNSVRLDARQQALARQMRQYWSNFATTGDPNLAAG